MGEVDKYSRGIVKDRNRLYWEDFKQIPSCCPPHSEQVSISDAIAQATLHIGASVESVRQTIALLVEYRTRLVADVVTGKLDVREAAAQLPDEPEETASLDDAEVLDAAEDASTPGDLDLEPEEVEA